MKRGIVGAEAAKFTPQARARACYEIEALLRPGDVVISGRCPNGGIDIWAVEIALQRGLRVIEYPPETLDWKGFRARNVQIAEAYDEGVCITPRELPPGYQGRARRVRGCYHCRRDDHVLSGGCWTLQYGRRLGKPDRVIVV